jgi:hypothetical protein
VNRYLESFQAEKDGGGLASRLVLSIPFENPGAVARGEEGAAPDRVRMPLRTLPTDGASHLARPVA